MSFAFKLGVVVGVSLSGSRGSPNRAPTPMEITEQLKGIPAATPARSELLHRVIEEVKRAELTATKIKTSTSRESCGHHWLQSLTASSKLSLVDIEAQVQMERSAQLKGTPRLAGP